MERSPGTPCILWTLGTKVTSVNIMIIPCEGPSERDVLCGPARNLECDHEDRTEKHNKTKGAIVISESRSQCIVPGNPSKISRDV